MNLQKVFLTAIALVFSLSGGLFANQATCDYPLGNSPYFRLHQPSYLELILADYPFPSTQYATKMANARPGIGAGGWMDMNLALGKSDAILNYVQADQNFPGDSVYMRYLYAGLALMQSGDYNAAADAFANAQMDSCVGTANYLRLAAAYAHKYSATGESPIFGHFNGGFTNFLTDSLPGDIRAKSIMLGKAQTTMFAANRLLGGQNPVLMELIADLLLNGPDPNLNKWLAATALLRVAISKSGEDSVAYEKKAIYCLESDRVNPKYFNRYRFNKLRKALKTDLGAVKTRQASFHQQEDAWVGSSNPMADIGQYYPGYPPAGEASSYLPEREGSELMTLFIKEQKRKMGNDVGPNPNSDPMNPDIDLKGIKSNAKFNFYAIGVIGAVLGAAIFMWIKIRNASRRRDEEE